MSGKLYVIGVGPGDPELITIKAVKTLHKADIIACPKSREGAGIAYNIAKEAVPEIEKKDILPLSFPMTRDETVLSEVHNEAAALIADQLEKDKTVALLTLGDPAFYSSAFYVVDILKNKGYDIEIISGVPSFSGAAAGLMQSLALGDEQVLITTPQKVDFSFPGTIVVMKAGMHLADLKEKMTGRDVYLVENSGMEDEKIYHGDLPDKAGYLSLLIVK